MEKNGGQQNKVFSMMQELSLILRKVCSCSMSKIKKKYLTARTAAMGIAAFMKTVEGNQIH